MSYTPKNPNGQATKANSQPVVIASDQDVLSTSAKQDTIIGHLDGVETLLTTIDGRVDSLETLVTSTNTKLDTVNTNLGTIDGRVDGLETAVASTNTKLDTVISQTDSLEASNNAIQAAVEILDNAISGNEMQVDVVASLPAGNNNIGHVDVDTLPAVHFQDLFITGQGSQLALNQNVVLASAGTGSTDTLNGTTGQSYRSIAIAITPAAGTVTAGVVSFEGSNDNTNFTPIFLNDQANITSLPVSTYGPTASTTRYFRGAIGFRYFRARISTGLTGTTTGLQAFTVFSPIPFSDPRMTVSQATAASLNATITGVLTTVTPGTAATNLGKARDSAIGATDTGVAVLGVRRDTPTAETPVAGDYVVPQVSANGEQWVGMAASATNSPAKARDGVAGASDTGIPAFFVRRDTPTAVTPAAGDFEIPQISANGEQWVRLAGELADDAAFTVATTRVVPIGYLADETSTDSVDEGDVGAARITLDRKQIVANYAHTAGGATPYKLVSAASTNATSVKASAGQVYMITASNVNAAARYLKLYNKASAPTVGTDVPVHTFIIPGNTAGAGTNIPVPTVGLNFSTGIAFALTTEATDAGTTAVAASEIVVNLGYL